MKNKIFTLVMIGFAVGSFLGFSVEQINAILTYQTVKTGNTTTIIPSISFENSPSAEFQLYFSSLQGIQNSFLQRGLLTYNLTRGLNLTYKRQLETMVRNFDMLTDMHEAQQQTFGSIVRPFTCTVFNDTPSVKVGIYINSRSGISYKANDPRCPN